VDLNEKELILKLYHINKLYNQTQNSFDFYCWGNKNFFEGKWRWL